MELPSRIRWRHIRRFYEYIKPLLKASPVKTNVPDSGRVLVLAPQIDDDVIGVGGCLRKNVEMGNDVAAVYPADCTPVRIGEAKEAADVIGFRFLDFLPYEDRSLGRNPEVDQRIATIISNLVVDIPETVEKKKETLSKCGSQLISHDWIEAAISLPTVAKAWPTERACSLRHS